MTFVHNRAQLHQRQKRIFCFILFSTYLLLSIASAQIPNQIKPPLLSDDAYKVVAQFFEYEKSSPLLSEVVEKIDSGTYFREKVSFDGCTGSRVVGYFAYPKITNKSFPVVLLIHGLWGTKLNWFEDESFNRGGKMTKALIAEGFAVLALDAPYHGERTYENDYQGAKDPVKYSSWARDLYLKLTIENRRGIDYLSTRKEVDTTRIASLGLSLGGLGTFYLAALEPRLKVGVAGVTPMMIQSPVLYIENFAKRVNCKSFLMLMGNQDIAYSMADAKEMYDMIPIKNKNMIWFNSGHRLPVDYIKTSIEWLNKYLK